MIISGNFFFRICKSYFAAMSKATKIFHPVLQRSSSFIGLFFALILLTGSCPVKQFIKSNLSISINAKHGSKNNHTVSFNKDKNALSCCSTFQETKLKKVPAQQNTNPTHFTFCNTSAEKGFVIHAFLDGKHDRYATYTTPSPSTLPRFIEHRSIII